MPVTAATCVFTADVSDPHAADGTTATHHASAMTDSDRRAPSASALIPTETGSRTYVVTVTPDATQPFATKTTTVNVGAGATGYGPDINLSLRAQLLGRACSTPTASRCATSWSCRRRRRWRRRWRRRRSRSRGRRSRRPRAPTGASRCASIRATWDIGLVPPADAMLPRLWLTELDLDQDVDVGTITMPRGVMVHGVVHDPSGAPLAHANVRIYTVSSGNAELRAGRSAVPGAAAAARRGAPAAATASSRSFCRRSRSNADLRRPVTFAASV